MEEKSFIDFLIFLRKNDALNNFIDEVEKLGTQDELAHLIEGDLYSSKDVQKIMYVNSIEWDKTEQGNEYWRKLEHKWFGELGVSPEEVGAFVFRVMLRGAIDKYGDIPEAQLKDTRTGEQGR